jgi:NAD+ synthase
MYFLLVQSVMRLLNYKSVVDSILDDLQAVVGHNKKVFIGISGGIDSALTAALCARAFDRDKVFGILMPYGQQTDIQDSRDIVKLLGIKSFEVDIKPMVDSFNNFDNKLVKANLMARTRMAVIYSYANLHEGLVMGTTNKSELMTGYFTKFGDGACDIEVIADLYKTEVFQLAKYLEIPKNFIDKKPSAGLWDGQSDEGEMGFTYIELDKFLQGEHVDSDTENKINNLFKNSEHKRNLPPIISID